MSFPVLDLNSLGHLFKDDAAHQSFMRDITAKLDGDVVVAVMHEGKVVTYIVSNHATMNAVSHRVLHSKELRDRTSVERTPTGRHFVIRGDGETITIASRRSSMTLPHDLYKQGVTEAFLRAAAA